MYKELSVEEAELEMAGWLAEHDSHEGNEVKTGSWALHLHCPVCGTDDTLMVKNSFYDEAMAGHKAGARAVLY